MRDYACGGHSYDGHTGIDSIVRSFREVRIGVPVFAALDGRVLSVQRALGGDFKLRLERDQLRQPRQALSDVISRTSVKPSETRTCSVTPSDGRRAGPTVASAAVTG